MARLGLTEEEIGKFQKELSSILDYVEKLKEVDVENIEPMSHSVKTENVMREDQEKPQKEKSKVLLDSAPETKNGYLKVKQIL